MKAAIVYLLVALTVGANAAKPFQSRTLLGGAYAENDTGAETKGKGKNAAYAEANVVATKGSVTAVAKSTSKSFTKVKHATATALSHAVSKVKNGDEVDAAAYAAAESISTAIAAAYVDTVAYVESDSKGNSGCAKAFASASAAALAYAEAYAEAVAEAENDYGYAYPKAKAKSIAVATADAYAKAESSVCLYGKGYAYSAQKSLAVSIVKAYAKAVAKAIAGVDYDGHATAHGEGKATADIKDEVTVGKVHSHTFAETEDGSAFTKARGVAVAQTGLIDVCPDVFIKCCRPERGYWGYSPLRTCSCGYRCKLRLKHYDGGHYNVYKMTGRHYGYKKGFKCYCPYY